MKQAEPVVPHKEAFLKSGWAFAMLIAGIVLAFAISFGEALAEKRKKEHEANEAIIATTVAVKGTPYRIRETVTRLPSGRCATVMERFELWNGNYLVAPEVSVYPNAERSCE